MRITFVLASLLFLPFQSYGADALSELPAPAVVTLQADLPHVQGIEVEGDFLWVTSVDRNARKGYLHLFRLSSGRLVRQVEVQNGDRYHPGGISLSGGRIWVPVAEYQKLSTTEIQQRDPQSLALVGAFVVNDHIGCVAARPGLVAGGNWDARQVYLWSPSGDQKAKMNNSSGTAYQDMKWDGDQLVASGVISKTEGAVEWMTLPGLAVRRKITAGITDRGVPLTNEGMAVRGGKLYLLPEDGPSRLFVFSLR